MAPYVLMLQADDDDKLLTQSILDEMESVSPMIFMDKLDHVKIHAAKEGSPAVILVNNNDHRHRAMQLLKALKADELLGHIPVVILGEITTREYIQQYYRAGASSYIIKPSTVDATRKKIRLFLEYWLGVTEV